MFFTDDDLKSLRERNDLRIKAAIEMLGEKWVYHKANSTKKIKKKKK